MMAGLKDRAVSPEADKSAAVESAHPVARLTESGAWGHNQRFMGGP